MAQKISQCRIVLFRTDPNKYSPAIVESVNEDGSVNLTVFKPGGDTGLETNITEGPDCRQWEWPGVDSLSEEPQVSGLASAYPIPGQK